jgi:hypothetical protein
LRLALHVVAAGLAEHPAFAAQGALADGDGNGLAGAETTISNFRSPVMAPCALLFGEVASQRALLPWELLLR